MNEFFATIMRLFGQVVFWAMVEPWEQAIRVRAGKHVRRLMPGLHFRIPILDLIYKQTVRLRTSMVATQTLSTHDGHTLIVGATVGYCISDIEKLYRGLFHAEDTIIQMAAGELAAEVFGTERSAVRPDKVGLNVTARLQDRFAAFGLAGVSVRVTDFAFVRAFRIVNDTRWPVAATPLSVEAA